MFIVTRLNDKPLNIVTTFVQSVHLSPAHNHEDGHAPITDTLTAGRHSTSCSQLD